MRLNSTTLRRGGSIDPLRASPIPCGPVGARQPTRARWGDACKHMASLLSSWHHIDHSSRPPGRMGRGQPAARGPSFQNGAWERDGPGGDRHQVHVAPGGEGDTRALLDRRPWLTHPCHTFVDHRAASIAAGGLAVARFGRGRAERAAPHTAAAHGVCAHGGIGGRRGSGRVPECFDSGCDLFLVQQNSAAAIDWLRGRLLLLGV